MHRIVEQPTGDPTGPLRVSRRALLEGSASSALGAAAIGWSSSVIGPDSASAADSIGGGSPRQMAAFRIRQTNIALGRDAAGVHYRSDSIRGLFVGEQQALGLLRDYSRTYNERFDGFIVRKFNGDRVKITSGEVRPH